MKPLPIAALLLIAMTAQATEIVIEPVHYASQLSGEVVDTMGTPLSDVSVEVVPCGAGAFRGHFLVKELEIARTDTKGKFVSARVWHHEDRTCISFSRNGFNYHQFELKYKPDAGPLVVKLTIAA